MKAILSGGLLAILAWAAAAAELKIGTVSLNATKPKEAP
jgi:hypothetical protein